MEAEAMTMKSRNLCHKEICHVTKINSIHRVAREGTLI